MSNSSSTAQRPGVLLVLILLSVAIAHSLFPSLLFPLVSMVTGVDAMVVMSSLDTDPIPTYQNTLLLVQGLASLMAFILVPYIFLRYVEKTSLDSYLSRHGQSLSALSLVVGTTLSFMFFNSIFIEWNLNVQFPEPFHGMAKELERLAELATDYLISFYSFPYFFAALIVVAVIPALGEELLFRGLIQRYSLKFFGNIHVAIWVTAFLFSAFHLQFFGFLPRMLLGAFFGYLFYYSGNLWYAIAAHFVNNGFTLIMLYLYQLDHIDYDIENTETIPLQTVAIFFIIGLILFTLFVRKFQNSGSQNHG